MPNAEPNHAEAHLALHRSMTGVPVERGSPPPSAPKATKAADNMTSTATPVIGAGAAAPLEQALNRGDKR